MIRNAQVTDLDWIMTLDNQVLRSRWTSEDYQKVLESTLVIDKLTGFLSYKKSYDVVDLLQIVVSEAVQGSTAAYELYNAFESQILEEGCRTVFLEVSALNTRAIRFYERQGYVVNRIRDNYYGHTVDGLEMRKDLSL